MKILIIKISSLGDLIHAIPAVNLIKSSLPAAQIDWLCLDKFAGILETQDSINEVIKIKNKKLATLTKLSKQLKTKKYDYVIDMQGLIKTAFFARQISANLIGVSKPREQLATWFYEEKLDIGEVLDNNSHVIDKNLDFAKLFLETLNKKVEIKVDFAALTKPEEKSEAKYQKVCIIPGTTWETKFWLAENWAEVMTTLRKRYQSQIFITGTSADLMTIENILLHYKDPLALVIDKDFDELTKLYSQMDLIIGVDTGPLHIAAAVNYGSDKRIIGIYGPSSATRSGPYGFEALSYDEIFRTKASHKRLIKDDGHSIAKIKPEMVIDVII